MGFAFELSRPINAGSAYRKSEELLQISGDATYRDLECAHTRGKDRRIIAAVETRVIPSSAQSFPREGCTIPPKNLLPSPHWR